MFWKFKKKSADDKKKHAKLPNKQIVYSKTCVKQPLSKRLKIGFQDQLSLNAGQKYCRMLQGEHSAILSTFIKLPIVIKIFVLFIFVWLFNTGFTVPVSTETSLRLHEYQYQHYCNNKKFSIFS